MKKTSLYIDEQVDAALGRLAAQRGISKAELIRRELADAAQEAPAPRLIGIGTMTEGPADLAENDEYYLAKIFAGD